LVLYDYLIDPGVLQHAPSSAELVCLGHHSTGRVMSQQQINARMVEAAGQGRTVVRLKGGDPSVFGRMTEEIEALCAAGIPAEVVPGVTTALAVAGYAGIPLTHPLHASAVALVTGQERRGKPESRLDYAALARFPGTLIFYMGVTTARHWSRSLIGQGKSPATPVAVVRRCSWPEQQTIHCTLETVAEVISEQKLRPPAVILVGEAVAVTFGLTSPAFPPVRKEDQITSNTSERNSLMSHGVEISFDCLPLRSISRFDVPIDAPPEYEAKVARVRRAKEKHGLHNSFYLHNAKCVFRLTNDPDLGMLAFHFEGTVLTDPGDQKTLRCDLDVELHQETCDWLTEPVTQWFKETVNRAVQAEFDRYIAAGDLQKTIERMEKLQAESDAHGGFLGMGL